MKKNKKTLLIVLIIVGLILVAGGVYLVLSKDEKDNTNYCLIRFNSNGGTLIEDKKIECGTKVKKPTDPTKDGFNFDNWYYVGEVYNFDSLVNEDITLIASWNALDNVKVYMVSFDTDGGTLIAPVEAAEGKTINAPLIPEKEGYEFVNWTLNNQVYNFETPITSNITLKAVYKKNANKTTTTRKTTKTTTTKGSGSNPGTTTTTKSGQNSKTECALTSSGLKSCLSTNLTFSNIKGTWYLKGTDEVYINIKETSSAYEYKGTRFMFNPSRVNYSGGEGSSLSKSGKWTAAEIARYLNITNVTSSSITIDNKFVFYKQKNYPTHVKSEVEKLYDNVAGTWYLEGYNKDVYVTFTKGTKNGEKTLNYKATDFCAKTGNANSVCSGASVYYYYTLSSELKSNNWSYSNGYLYNIVGNTKKRFSKTPSTTPVTSVKLNKTGLEMKVGESSTLVATVSPSNASNKNVSWSSSNTHVATVSNGKVVAKGVGTATITVTTNDGSKKSTCVVNVSAVKVSSIKISKETLSLYEGDSSTLSITFNPSNTTNKEVTWVSSNTNVATVSNGKVVAKSVGTATITATSKDGNKSVNCVVTVSKRPLSGTGDISYTMRATTAGSEKGIEVVIKATGGTGPYTYTIKLYNASGLIKEVTEVKDNKLFVSNLGSGQYYAKFTIWDAEGNKYSGSIPTVKITANF